MEEFVFRCLKVSFFSGSSVYFLLYFHYFPVGEGVEVCQTFRQGDNHMPIRIDYSVQFPISEVRAIGLFRSPVYAYPVGDMGSPCLTHRLASLCVFEPMRHVGGKFSALIGVNVVVDSLLHDVNALPPEHACDLARRPILILYHAVKYATISPPAFGDYLGSRAYGLHTWIVRTSTRMYRPVWNYA